MLIALAVFACITLYGVGAAVTGYMFHRGGVPLLDGILNFPTWAGFGTLFWPLCLPAAVAILVVRRVEQRDEERAALKSEEERILKEAGLR